MKKTKIILFSVFNLLSLAYLIYPAPILKDLPNSAKSNLPGDTDQIPNTNGYFTNMTRTEVTNFYQATYTGPFRIRLNHPPEKARDIWHQTTQSYYLEEYVLPFKESLFVNGFEWENDVFTPPQNRAKNRLIYQNKEYKAKITTRIFPTSLAQRLIVFFATQAVIIFALHTYYSLLRQND